MIYFKQRGQNLFCQDYLIQNALLHTNQFLKKLDKHFNFEAMFEQKLMEVYQGKCSLGSPAYKPSMILKMLFLAYLFNKSEREIERVINDSISMKIFLGLALDEKAPDHSSLTKFKNRILKFNDIFSRDIFKEVFDDIIESAIKKGINLGFTQSIDSTHTIANVNNKKEQKRTKKLSDGGEGKKPRDKDAKWGVKRVKKVKDVNGKEFKANESYYGYKNHLSTSTKSNLITSLKTTAMNEYDGKHFEYLLREDVRKSITKKHKTIYTADKAYDDGENHVWLNQERMLDAIDLKYANKKENQTEDGKTKAKWTKFTTQEQFEEGLRERYAVERVNAGLKKWHGLDRARYLGLAKMKIQTVFSALSHNLKTLVRELTGTGLRTSLASRGF